MRMWDELLWELCYWAYVLQKYPEDELQTDSKEVQQRSMFVVMVVLFHSLDYQQLHCCLLQVTLVCFHT